LAAIAKRYGRALARVSFESGQHERVGQDLIQFNELLNQSRELQLFYTNPAIPLPKKRAATDELLRRLGFCSEVCNFIFVLVDNHRIRYFGEICKAFQEALNEHLGVVQADITTAFEVDSDIKTRLEQKLGGLTGKRVLLKFGISPALIGGVITRIGDTIYDGSVQQQLELIKNRLSSD
jgi:F-type H+-transporting ATPase subunit delta